MTWAKLDDRFHENRKIRSAWRQCPAAIGLHVMAITYCAGHDTDGFVDVDWVDEKIPGRKAQATATAALVETGLWVPGPDGWWVHDFLEYNPSRAEVKGRRERLSAVRAEAGRKGAAKRWEGKRDGKLPDGKPASDGPDPSRPVPTNNHNQSGSTQEVDGRRGVEPGLRVIS